MIRLNLLPHREAERKRQQEQFNAAVVLAILVGGIIAFLIYGALVAAIDVERENIAVLEGEIKVLENDIKEIKDLESQIAALQARQRAVEDIQADRNSPVRMLTELSANLPKGVMLTKLSQKDLDLLLEGSAESNEKVAEFMTNLGRPEGWFVRPELVEITSEIQTLASKEQVKVFKFSLKVALLRSQAAERPTAGASTALASASAPVSAPAAAPVASAAPTASRN